MKTTKIICILMAVLTAVLPLSVFSSCSDTGSAVACSIAGASVGCSGTGVSTAAVGASVGAAGSDVWKLILPWSTKI